ncbi:hypothetical protein MdSGHV095 [Musca domestica salivary gland hypertrophy virus]|uniref:Uncharacterized protein n=1 Tax=Musca hytrovirus(isolate Musca domestica/United States/Boucias/-) TaxID=523909 RepID=B2YG72_MHVB|nr:hypothetical protein MdSGHV095 [Musca domestica salivary gland hypertrophy virus]ACD03554.1 hypothetical protein MdSGHV095 [Musca domestica salivary gland hypertrophy virus]
MSTMEDPGAPANPERRLGVTNFPLAYMMYMMLEREGDDDGGDTSSDTGLESDLDSDVGSENESTNSDKDDEDEPKENPATVRNRRVSLSSSDEDEPGNLSPAECLRRRVQKIRDYRDLLKSRQQVANVNFKYFIGRKKED